MVLTGLETSTCPSLTKILPRAPPGAEGLGQLHLPWVFVARKCRARSTAVRAIIAAKDTIRITSSREKEHLDLLPGMLGMLWVQRGARGTPQ